MTDTEILNEICTTVMDETLSDGQALDAIWVLLEEEGKLNDSRSTSAMS